MLEAMKAEGLDLDACIRVLSAGEKRVDTTAAERQRRSRAKRASRRDITRDPPNDNTLTPGVEANASPPIWVCPAKVDPEHWADLLKNRKTKRLTNTATAYTDLLADLDRLADEEWPPGLLVRHAAVKGWGAIYDPRNQRNGNQHHPNIGKSAAAYHALAAHLRDNEAF